MKQAPLSQSQLGIYLGSAYRDDLTYHIAYRFRFDAATDPARLRDAVKSVLRAHPALNAAILTDDAGEVSMVWDEETIREIPIESMSDDQFEAIRPDLIEHIEVPGCGMCRFRIVATPGGVWLVMVIHHIIYDGSSMRLFLRDLTAALGGTAPQRESFDCFDLSLKEIADRRSDTYDSHKEYYTATFGDFDTDGAEPFADGPGGNPSFSRKVVRLSMPLEDFKGGSAMANAAMGMALGAFTGRDDVLFTTIYHGRNTPLTAETVGMIVRTLPVRCHLGADVTPSSLVKEMKEQRNATRALDLFSFADFTAMTGYRQNILFGYQGSLLEMDSLLPDAYVERLDAGDTGVPISIQMFLAPDGIDVDLIWRSDLYSEAMVSRLVDTIDLALRQLCDPANADRPLSSLSLVTREAAGAMRQLEYNPQLNSFSPVAIHEVIHRRALQCPDDVAVVAGERSYTYAEIDRRADDLARSLQEAGVGSGATVGVMIPRSEWMVIIPLAVMKTGAAYMPLDPTFPEERLLFMTADAGVDTILTVNALADGVLPGFEGRILDAESLAMRADDLYDPAHPVGESMVSDLDSPFVVLYTSGSTGRPKGVTLTKGNLLNFCGDYIELAALTPADRVPAYANFGFDAHMMDIYPTLMAGGRLYVLDEELRHDLDAMHDYFLEHRISAAFLTTQIAWQMITLYEFPDLRWLACGGEKLPPTGELPFRFANVYGPTECSVLTTCHIPDGATDGTVIGRPLPGYEVRVLDRWQRRVPRGVPGELVIMGPSVGAGYLNRPDLTAEKFITIEGIPAYRTGDLVRWNEDGEIRFMGRMDGMVKMRGLRIELGEIEAVATRHEAVRQFAAAVKEVGGNDQLVGYYSVREGMDVSPEELREFMAADLTEFMIPTVVIRLDRLPMNQNGKIDRKALPVPEMEISEEIVAPSTPEEHRIAGYVAEVLGHDSFGVTTNLLKVGLTSLLTMRLVATIAKRLNVRISSKEAMAEPTVRGLVSAIAAATGGDESASGVATPSRPIRKYYPITENQRGILIDWERNRDALQYNVAQAIRILPDADLGRLREAIATAVKAHPALGSRFINRNGDIMQERRPVQEVLIEEITLDHTPDVKDMQALMRPFDLFGEPLYRFAIVRHADEAWLFMDFHHIVFDGVSAMVFFNTLSEAYAEGEVAAEEYSAFEWADDEAALLRSSEYEEAEQWFASLLEGTETTVYPHSSVAEPVTPGTLMRCAVEVDAAAIDSFCSRHALTPSNFFLAIFMQTLHRLTRNEKVVITTVNNGRNDVRLMDDVGMFVKTLPVVSALSPAQAAGLSPAAMALGLQEQFNSTRGFDFYPFTEMVRRFDLRPEIMYVYEGGISLDATSGPLSTRKIPLALDTAKVPLTLLIFTPEPGQYRMELEFDASLYNTEDMTRLLDMLSAAVGKYPSAAVVKDAELLSAAMDAELEKLRDGEQGPVGFTSYHGAFEEAVDACPERRALVACDRELTFAEMDAEANRVANALRSRGVDRGDKVVVLLPRDSRLPVAIYGVMKAGAAYIPCDPEYPVERIRLITEDSDAKWIITTADRLDSFPDKGIDVEELLACADASRPGVTVDGNDPAYLIYTSGSTGRPKGVVIHHAAAANYLYGYRELIYRPMGADEPKVNMLIVTISFDASHVDLGTSLTSGHTLVLANEEECKDVTLLAELMQRAGVEAFDATPSRLAAMLELPAFCEAVAKCKLLNIGGEAIPASLLPKLEGAGFRGLTVNEYGPTETTVGSNHAVLSSSRPVTVGRPFYNYREYICDAWGGELPVGAVGELVIAGRSVGKGYHNLPEKTAESFISFRGAPAYRTGDLARWLPDGDVDVLGRIDHQVKLRGLRIELGEIESVANSFRGVKMSVANVCRIGNVDHLCIWYEGEGVDQEQLRMHLQRHLTDYMVPDSFNPVDKIPVTPNGKLDRKNLPAPVLEALAEYVEPAEGLESIIAEAFRRTLSLERVGADDDFFKIGGTSINAIKVVALLSSDGYSVRYKDLFAARTPRTLAAAMQSCSTTGTDLPADAAPADTEASPFAPLLGGNTVQAFLDGERQSVGNVFLTGGTGFLGVHILHELIVNTDAQITCLVRRSQLFDASSRLRTLLFYYFGDTYEAIWNERIFVVSGDLTDRASFDMLDPERIDTVINCAASVKHFAPGDEIQRANVDTVRNIVEWCSAHDRRLIHISTVSVAGEADLRTVAHTNLTEQTLDLGQDLANQYVKSKYDAETIILNAISEQRIAAKIMRVGNISPRESDGEFQANFQSNAFMGRLRAYLTLGCIPYSHLTADCEFSPVDQLARSILDLATSPQANIVFHPLNNHHVPMADVIDVMNEVLPLHIECVETDRFTDRLNQAMATEGEAVTRLQPLLAYQSADGNTAYIGASSEFTNEILFRYRFRWSPTSKAYIRNFITAIAGLGYFDPTAE